MANSVVRKLKVKTSASGSVTEYDIGSTAAKVNYTPGTAGSTIGTTVQSALDYLNQQNSNSESELIHIDSYSLIGETYSRSIMKYGKIKIATIIFSYNTTCRIGVDTWSKVYELPIGYELLSNDSVETACITNSNTNTSYGLAFKVTPQQQVDVVFRVKPSSSITVWTQLVFI